MIDTKEFVTDTMKIYKTAFDEGYKKGFIDGKLEGLKEAQEIADKVFERKPK